MYTTPAVVDAFQFSLQTFRTFDVCIPSRYVMMFCIHELTCMCVHEWKCVCVSALAMNFYAYMCTHSTVQTRTTMDVCCCCSLETFREGHSVLMPLQKAVGVGVTRVT